MELKSLFGIGTATKQPVQQPQSKITFEQYGRKQAEALGGTADVVEPALHAVYKEVSRQVAEDEAEQEKRKDAIRAKIAVTETANENLKRQIEDKTKELKFEEKKIEDAKSEIETIRRNPSKVTNEKGSARASFIIGLIILAALTIYLFVFYSSAAYSAFFKIFTSSRLGTFDAIFDPQALSHAFHDGFTELILIITIPAVFLGLGFLIHKFSSDTESNRWANYAKIAALMLVTFAFDAILAYEITEKIYNIKQQMSFSSTLPDYSIPLAFQSISFWLIIFSGFVVYIIWGFVFNFVMKEYYKLDRVRVAIDTLEEKIKGYKTTCKDIKASYEPLKAQVTQNEGKIKEWNIELGSPIFLKSDIEQEVNNFINGWLAYMEYKAMPTEERTAVISKKKAFLNSISTHFKSETPMTPQPSQPVLPK